MKKYLPGLLSILICCACSKFEDASLTDRKTFMHLYTSGASYEGMLAEVDHDGGYIVAGHTEKEDGSTDAMILKVDSRGFKVWETKFVNSIIRSVKVTESGYLLFGDGIEINEDVPISEIVNTQAKLVFMDRLGNVEKQIVRRGTTPQGLEIDFHGNAVTIDNNGKMVLLGSYKDPNENEQSFIASYSAGSTTDQPEWIQTYGLRDRDYKNCNSIFVTPQNRLVWASRTFLESQSFSRQYINVSVVLANSTFQSNSMYGQNDEKNHTVEDIQASPTGYVVIGSYLATDGANSNTFFVRMDGSGAIIPGSERYFDVGNALGTPGDPKSGRDQSSVEDHGVSVTFTGDGYVIAGYFESTPTLGNGGRDIILIKTDVSGDLVWTKVIGSGGDETIKTIRSLPDGGLILCGTNGINGLSSIMLIRTDSQGQIID
jgi:hypothetical protein